MSRPFRFRQFEIIQETTPMKVGTDGVLLGAWADGGRRILDVGTGTGLVALMMAQRFPDAEVSGIDISDEAVEESGGNVSRSPFGDRVRIVKADFRMAPADVWFDAVVCNPPYFERSLKSPSEGRSLARHSDTLSLDDLIRRTASILTENGTLSVIIPYSACDEAIMTASRYGFAPKRMMKVRGTVASEWKRVMIELELDYSGGYAMEELTLERERGVRTPEYSELTKDFYL